MSTNNQNTSNSNGNGKGKGAEIFVSVVFIVFVIIGLAMCNSCDSGPSRYSQLSPQEQERARWAYEVQQAQRDYERGR